MKKISIISPDTVPLDLTDACPNIIIEDGREYPVKDKCTRSTGLGKRAWEMAGVLSKNKDFQVTLFVPDINYPGKDNVDTSDIHFRIRPYNFKAATWNWSEELDRKLKHEDFVIIQSASGTGFLNCSVLPYSVNVILDGHVPILAELPCSLLGYSSIYKKTFWNRFFHQYTQLVRRADCILYANDNQYHYYEGQLFTLNKLDWSAYQFSPLHKVPFGVNVPENYEVPEKEENGHLKLLWFGSIYPWYNPEAILTVVEGMNNVSIDFIGIVHPRYKKSYYNYFKKFFDRIGSSPNITVIEEYEENREDLYKDYDAGIILAQDWLEEKYSVRNRVLDMLAHKLPVFINKGNPMFHELHYGNGLIGTDTDSMRDDLDFYASNKKQLTIKEDTINFLRKYYNWDKVLSPLSNYISRFQYDTVKRQWIVLNQGEEEC